MDRGPEHRLALQVDQIHLQELREVHQQERHRNQGPNLRGPGVPGHAPTSSRRPGNIGRHFIEEPWL